MRTMSRGGSSAPQIVLACWLVLLVSAAQGGDGRHGGASADEGGSPPELGDVRWMRDFDAATKKAKGQHKPMLVLFQEVPGCSTCVDYGRKVLSHPLVVEAAETLFVPVAVYNNVPGNDERTLKSFQEKAWNNPVVRVIDPDRTELAPRVASDYSVGGIATAMAAAVKKPGRTVPRYLELLAEESAARNRGLRTATFAMHCFWEGESALGTVPGVIATRPGFIGTDEVVEVQFDPTAVNFDDLLAAAVQRDCAGKVYTRSDELHTVAAEQLGTAAVRSDDEVRPDKEPKYYLAQTVYRHLPMTSLQATRVNAAIHAKDDPDRFLSPRQIELLGVIRAHPSADWPNAVQARSVPGAWRAAVTLARPFGLSF